MKARDFGLLTAAVALVLDQVSKVLVLYGLGLVHMGPGQSVPVLPFFNLVMVWNAGISYGLFPAAGPEGIAILATFQLLAAGALASWLWFVHRPVLAVSLGLLIGGALGNLVDRLVYGDVADFFHFYGFGVVGLLYDALLKPDSPQGETGKE